MAFRSWTSALPSFVQLCPVMLPGRETRSAEPPLEDFTELSDAVADELQPWLDLPYCVFGHSMGALLAFEWVRRIRRNGYNLPRSLFLSGRCAPDTFRDSAPLRDLPDAEFLDQLHGRYEGIPAEFLRDSELLEFYLPILRADISIVESYSYHDETPLDCPITVFAGVNDPSLTWEEVLGWKRQTGRQFTAQLFPGGHFYPPAPLLQTLSSALTELDSTPDAAVSSQL